MAKSRENLDNHIRDGAGLFNFDGPGQATDEQGLDSFTRRRFTSEEYPEVGRRRKAIATRREPEEPGGAPPGRPSQPNRLS